jgi:hypothetical protein
VIAEPGRSFVREASIPVMDHKENRRIDRVVFLFSDMVMLCSVANTNIQLLGGLTGFAEGFSTSIFEAASIFSTTSGSETKKEEKRVRRTRTTNEEVR